MKNNASRELLDDILAGESDSCRQQSLASTLAAVRRRKTVRRIQHSAIATLAISALLILRSPSDKSIVSQSPELAVPSLIIHTRPLRAEQIVTTRSGSVETVTTLRNSSIVIHTMPEKRLYEELNDQQLLALLDGRQAMILRSPEFDTRLIVEDESIFEGFPVN